MALGGFPQAQTTYFHTHTLTKNYYLKRSINRECVCFITPLCASEAAGNGTMKKPIILLRWSQTKQHRRYPPLTTANYQARDISPHVIIMFYKLPPLARSSSSEQRCFCTGLVSLVLLWRQAQGTVSLTKLDKLAPRLPLRDEGWSGRVSHGCRGDVLAASTAWKQDGQCGLSTKSYCLLQMHETLVFFFFLSLHIDHFIKHHQFIMGWHLIKKKYCGI